MRAGRGVSLSIVFIFLLSMLNAQHEKKTSFNIFGGVSLLPGNEKINKLGQPSNIFGGYPVALTGGIGVNYKFSAKTYLSNNVHYLFSSKPEYKINSTGVRVALRYYPLSTLKKFSPFVTAGGNLNLVGISRARHQVTHYPDPSSSGNLGTGITASQIIYNYEKLKLSFVPMPGLVGGAGASLSLSPKLSVFAEYNYNFSFSKASSLMKENFSYNTSNFTYHFITAGVTIKLLHPSKQMIASLPKESWDGDPTVTVKGTLVYKKEKKAKEVSPPVLITDFKDTVLSTVASDNVGIFVVRNLRQEDYRFYLEKRNRKILNANLEIIHDNQRVAIFEDYPELEMIDDFNTETLISRDNNFSVILREGFQHEVDVTVLANSVVGKVTPVSYDSVCRRMLVFLKNRNDSIVGATAPDKDCSFNFNDVEEGKYTLVFVRNDSLLSDLNFSYEFTDAPPVIQRQFNTDEEPALVDYGGEVTPSGEDTMDIEDILLYKKYEKIETQEEELLALVGKKQFISGQQDTEVLKNQPSKTENQIAVKGGADISKETKNTIADKPADQMKENQVIQNNSVKDSRDSLNGNNDKSNAIAVDSKIQETKRETANTVPVSFEKFAVGHTYIPEGREETPHGYGVQVAAFSSYENARRFCQKLQKTRKEPVYVQVIGTGDNSRTGKLYRVVVGEYETFEQAEQEQKELKKHGYDTVLRKHKALSRGKDQ